MHSPSASVAKHVVAALGLVVIVSVAPAQIITDLLAEPSQWQPWMITPGADLHVTTGGTAPYLAGTADESFAAIYNGTTTLPYDSDWSLSAFAQINNPYMAPYVSNYRLAPGAWVGLEFVISPFAASMEDHRVGYGFEYGYWNESGPRLELSSYAFADGEEVPTGSNGIGTETPFAAMRMDFSSQDKTITFFRLTFDGGMSGWLRDGPALSLTSSGADFGMGAQDRFAVALVGNSSGVWADASFSNVRLITAAPPAAPVPEPSTYGLAGLAVLALAIARRRLRR